MKSWMAPFAAVVLGCAVMTPAFAQGRIGWTNLEVVLAAMPEVRAAEEQLAAYQRSLGQAIMQQQTFLQERVDEYTTMNATGQLTKADREKRAAEIQQLEVRLNRERLEAEERLMYRRSEVYAPILDRVTTAIGAVAKERGYLVVLNQTTSSGVSTILHAPDEDDVTEALFTRLGLPIPKEAP